MAAKSKCSLTSPLSSWKALAEIGAPASDKRAGANRAKSAPPKERKGLARDFDRMKAATIARKFREGKIAGADLAFALEVFAVRGTFETDWPGPATLATELEAFDEPGRVSGMEPNAASRKYLRDLHIVRRYDVLRARGKSHGEAAHEIADEGQIDLRRYDALLDQRLQAVDLAGFHADIARAIDAVPDPTTEHESRDFVRKLNLAISRCANRYGVTRIREQTDAECRIMFSEDTVQRALASAGRKEDVKAK